MIITHFPPTWTVTERNVYLKWSSTSLPLTWEEEIILHASFERIRKGDKPWCSLRETVETDQDQPRPMDLFQR